MPEFLKLACLKVVNHKDSFWRDGKARYDECRDRRFKLLPAGKAFEVLRADYNAMVNAGMFFGEAPAKFDDMMMDIASLETTLNTEGIVSHPS